MTAGMLATPHRRHVYQLLANEMEVAHWKVSVGYGVLQAVVGIGALILRGVGTAAVVVFLGVCFAGFWVFGGWIRGRVGCLAQRREGAKGSTKGTKGSK